MFIEATRRRNPDLIRTAAALHQAGEIPSNTFVVDIDAMIQNAANLRLTADQHGVGLYQMTKQHGRNPVAARAVARAGVDKTVCVDIDETRTLAAFGVKLGHVGHIQQVPDAALSDAVSLEPEVVTCFNLEKALLVARAAAGQGREQAVLLRVRDHENDFYPAQEGGVLLTDLPAVVERLHGVPGVRVAGVTTFPVLLFDPEQGEALPTRNLQTLLAAVDIVRASGVESPIVNAPGVSCCATIPVTKSYGATQVEPGSALLGNTPLHAVADQPEVPAMVYVTEVSHRDEENVYTLGGGHYPRSRVQGALVGASPEALMQQWYPASPYPADAIDYYSRLLIPPGAAAPAIGETVVYAFRSQIFTSRALVAPVVGLRAGRPRIAGFWNHLGYPVTREGRPLSIEEGEKTIAQCGF